MKLYTEEQVHKSIRFGFTLAMFTDVGYKEYEKEFIDSLTPIEIPSDEEIENKIKDFEPISLEVEVGIRTGAKWIRDKLTNT